MERPGVSLFAAGIIVRYPFGLKPQTAGGFEVLLKLDVANWPRHKRVPWVEEANALGFTGTRPVFCGCEHLVGKLHT
jgi:hypothetical protein